MLNWKKHLQSKRNFSVFWLRIAKLGREENLLRSTLTKNSPSKYKRPTQSFDNVWWKLRLTKVLHLTLCCLLLDWKMQHLEKTEQGCFVSFQGRRGSENVKHAVLKKFKKGVEPIHTTELEGGSNRVLYGEIEWQAQGYCWGVAQPA
eukprot:g63212.t1